MKDTRGHGSDGRGGGAFYNPTKLIPTKPFRESSTNHQLAIADQHGIPTAHFGKRSGGSPFNNTTDRFTGISAGNRGVKPYGR
jgi:hypothetical protein